MKRLIFTSTLSLLIVSVVLVVTGRAQVVSSAKVTTTASTHLVAPITLSYNKTPLDFGQIVPGTAVGHVVVMPNGSHTFDGGAWMKTQTTTAASLTVKGAIGYAFTVTLPSSSTKLNITGGGTDNMLLTLYTTDLPANKGAVPPGGNGTTFHIGGKLTVKANQAHGSYSGSFNVTVAYD